MQPRTIRHFLLKISAPQIHFVRNSRQHKSCAHHDDAQTTPDSTEKSHRQAEFVTWLGLAKNISLCAAKAIVGVQSNSAALVADAFHSLSDMVSDAVAMVALKVARRPPNPLHPYGHGKFEAVGALGVSTMLVAAGGGLIFHTAELCWSAQTMLTPSAPALYVSLACAGINEAMYHVTMRAGKAANSASVIANAVHHRADAGASVVAAVGIGGAMAGYPLLDPVAGGLVGLLIAHAGAEMAWESILHLTDAVDREKVAALVATIRAVPGVLSCSQVRHRQMGPYIIADASIQVEPRISVSAAAQVAERVRVAVREQMPEISEILVNVDPGQVGAGMCGRAVAAAAAARHAVGAAAAAAPRSHTAIEGDVRAVLGDMPDIRRVSTVLVHYIGGQVQVRVTVEVDPRHRILDVSRTAFLARRAVQERVAGVACAEVMLDVEDDCWGQCGAALGPACAIQFRAARGRLPPAAAAHAVAASAAAASDANHHPHVAAAATAAAANDHPHPAAAASSAGGGGAPPGR